MKLEFRVRYHEADRMGIAHHSHYFTWFEIGRVELLRTHGFLYADWEDAGFFLPVIESRCQYISPVYFDDLIELTINTPVIEKIRLHFDYVLWRRRDKKLLTKARTTHVVVNRQSKPIKWPAAVKKFLETIV